MLKISLADTKNFGVLRMLVDDTYNAANALRDKGFIFALTPVIAVSTTDEPGSLCEILNIFDEADINLEYLYDVNTGKKDRVYLIFKVGDIELATDILRKKCRGWHTKERGFLWQSLQSLFLEELYF